MKTPASAAFVFTLALVAVHPAAAGPIDGTLDSDDGPSIVVQTTQTNNNNPFGQVNSSGGYELDEAYGTIANGTLHLFLGGNMVFTWNIEGITVWLPADLFIDSQPGGQNTLVSSNPNIDQMADLTPMAGLTFDAGFAADYWLCVTAKNGASWPILSAYYATLPTGGGGTGLRLGDATTGGPGAITGGSNPYGIEMSVDLSNVAGVGLGCGAASGAGVTTGIEWSIPLAAIGNPTGCIEVNAMMPCASRTCVTNQMLGPLPPGTCGTLAVSTLDLNAYAGAQHFTVCPDATPTHRTSWGELKTIYR